MQGPDGAYRVSADIGGTFTDLVAIDEQQGVVSATKVSSRPVQPADGVLEGLADLVGDVDRMDFFVHGQTVGLNAFLERKGTRVLLLMTEGVRDSYSIARHDRKDLYALQYRKPERLVPRGDTVEVRERMRWDGSVELPLDADSLEPILRRIDAESIEAVAVCFLHAYVNPAHEVAVRDLLLAHRPDLAVTLSHEVAREWREYERASSAALNAYVAPSVERYLAHLEGELDGLGMRVPVHVMQSSGGITTAGKARRQPIQTLLSGPVGGTIGGAAIARMTERPNLLCVDMGGTSFDLSLIVDGSPSVSTETELEGLPVLVPLVDIHTIGAGGGSLAWLEAGGLRVGPQSAGALPGPACYGRGGTEPTVTDANLVLGRLEASHFLGGRMALDETAALGSMAAIAGELSLDPPALAEGILAIVNAAMADAMRTITVKQGIDPRRFSLVAFGGAGPMHAVELARELDIGEVIVPWSPGTFSAWGMLQTDIRHDVSISFFRGFGETSPDELTAEYARLEAEGLELLEEDGVARSDVSFARTAELRYVGQEYSVTVPVSAAIDPVALEHSFHAAHETRYGHCTPGLPIEFVNLRVAALGLLARIDAAFTADVAAGDPEIGTRTTVFGGTSYEARVLLRSRLPVGARHAGPLLVQEDSATTVVPPGSELTVDPDRNLVIATS